MKNTLLKKIFSVTLLIFAISEFIIFGPFFIFIIIFYGICIVLYCISSMVFIRFDNKEVIRLLLFLLSSITLILAGLTDIDYNFFGPEKRIINFVSDSTSDICFIISSLFSILLLITCVLGNLSKRKNMKK